MDHNLYETIKNVMVANKCNTTIYWVSYIFAYMKFLGRDSAPKNEERPSIRFYREIIKSNDEEQDKTYVPDINFSKHLKTRVKLCKNEVMQKVKSL